MKPLEKEMSVLHRASKRESESVAERESERLKRGGV